MKTPCGASRAGTEDPPACANNKNADISKSSRELALRRYSLAATEYLLIRSFSFDRG
jgi:hypothetical protein